MRTAALLFISLLFLCGCENNVVIINDIPQREANEIVVFLASKDIIAVKLASTSAGPGAAPGTEMTWNIAVDEKKRIDALAVLNYNGLPRKKSTTLLELFAKQGLISSEKEEVIRYQAGLAAQIAGTIRKIDGVIDANVELSIPEDTGVIPGMQTEGTKPKRVKASVYVKHQGIVDDPNSHLISKIKRLVSGSVTGLDVNDVTVISDRSRFTDITLQDIEEDLSPKMKEYVSIWSIVMNRASTTRFRFLFFSLIFATIIFAVSIGWMLWKFYPILKKRGIKNLFKPAPFQDQVEESSEE